MISVFADGYTIAKEKLNKENVAKVSDTTMSEKVIQPASKRNKKALFKDDEKGFFIR